MFTSSGSTPTDSLPQQHHQQQGHLHLQGGWQQPTEPRLFLGPVSNESSPGCRLVFDIDSDSQEGLPESVPLPQQWLESPEHNGKQQQTPHQPLQQQQQQQVLEQQANRSQTSGSVIGHGSMNNETFDGCQLEFDIDTYPETSAKPAQQHQLQQQQQQQPQQQQPVSNQQASRSIEGQAATDASEGCRLVFDIDSDPQDSPEQPLRHVTWQPTVESHGRSGNASPPGCCRVSMSQHELQLTDRQAPGAADNLHAVDLGFTQYPQTSRSVRHGAQYNTPGIPQHSQSAQTTPTALAYMQSPQRNPRMGPAPIAAAGTLQHSNTDAQALSPAQHDRLMQNQRTNSHRHLGAAEQLGPGAAAAQEDDGCLLVFEDEELGVIQEQEERMEFMQGLSGVASPELRHDADTAAGAAESGHPRPQCGRQQSLHSVTHDTLRQSQSVHLEHEHKSCPLVFLSETDQEQHFKAGASHTTGCMQTHFAVANGQSQNSPRAVPDSPAQPSQRGMHVEIVRPAQQRPDHMADNMTAHMASHVSNVRQDLAQHSTNPRSNIAEEGGDSVWCDDSRPMPAGTNIHSRQNSYIDGVFGSCGNIQVVQVSFLQV